ncbi:MAG TPA: L-histidine N(alpha)-methyltransferase [Balneolaceae bacterium]
MENQPPVVKQSILDEVLYGLHQPQKQLSSKFFYDERGSELFEKITGLKEYYPTRTEMMILKNNLGEISDLIGPKAMLIELGSGSSTKIRLLLKSLPELAAYVPVDISQSYLRKAARQLQTDFPDLFIKPVYADYTKHFSLPPIDADYKRELVFYPGSTIGNFHPDKAREFLKTIASLTEKDAAMLIGVDLKKDKQVLEAAYNDAKGITAAFNKNILLRLNREIGADFDVDSFRHRAFYNEGEGRIEMHLFSKKEQEVQIGDESFHFTEGESIHTENSYKYSLDDFKKLVSEWFSVGKVWTDEKGWFSLQYLIKK